MTRPHAFAFGCAAMLCGAPALAQSVPVERPAWLLSQAKDQGGVEALPAMGARTASAARVSGFFASTLAYTYADPAHWSRAVTRLQLNAEGGAGRVRWKLGGRVDVDPIYYGSDFYLPEVKRDQRLNFFWRENYIDFEAGGWDFRLGAQNIVWGEVVGLFFADVVSARDLRDFLLPSFDVIRIPQWAARAEYFKGDSHLELVWIPVPVFDNIGKPGSDFYPVPLPLPTPAAVAGQFEDPQRPERKLSNGNFGVRGNTLIKGWDLAAFYYRSYSTSPTFYRLPAAGLGLPPTYQPRYDRIWQTGGTVSKDFDAFVLRGELVYTSGRGYATALPGASEGVVVRPTLDAIVGTNFEPVPEWRVNLQAYYRSVLAGGESDLSLKSAGPGTTVQLARRFGDWEPQVLWIQNFRDAGGLVRPRVNWYAARNTLIAFGADIFNGPRDGYFGRYSNRDRVYAEVRFDF